MGLAFRAAARRPRQAISARRATSRRIRSCSTISPRGSSSTDGRSSGSAKRSCCRRCISSRATRAKRVESGRSERVAVASESAPARCRGLPRHARAFGRLLDERWAGCPGDVDEDTFYRRAIYGRVSRSRPPQVLALYDFPEATQTAPDRDVTTTTLQQIFMMNSAFIQNLAEAAAKTAATATGEAEQIGLLYRRILARDPTVREMKSAMEYLRKGTLQRLRAGAAGDQRGDFSSMSFKLTRRQMIENLGGGLGVVGLASLFGSMSRSTACRRRAWETIPRRSSRRRPSTSSCFT